MTYSTNWTGRSLLSATEEQELARIIESGREALQRLDSGHGSVADEAVIDDASRARRRFMEANVGLVLMIANRFNLPSQVDRQDVIQDGMIGLERAVEKFNWRKGYKFSTYATWWIRQAIQRGLENTASTIRIPSNRSSELRSALACSGGDVERLEPRLAAIYALGRCASIDRPIGEANHTLGALLPSDTEPPDVAATRRVEQEQVYDLLDILDPEPRLTVIWRYGLDGAEPATYREIGLRLGVTTETARRRILRALESLRFGAAALAARPSRACQHRPVGAPEPTSSRMRAS